MTTVSFKSESFSIKISTFSKNRFLPKELEKNFKLPNLFLDCLICFLHFLLQNLFPFLDSLPDGLAHLLIDFFLCHSSHQIRIRSLN